MHLLVLHPEGSRKFPQLSYTRSAMQATCLGGCTDNVYCSSSCAEADWASCHSLLCSGPPPVNREWARVKDAGSSGGRSSTEQPSGSR